jgi:hypothetical protein
VERKELEGGNLFVLEFKTNGIKDMEVSNA